MTARLPQPRYRSPLLAAACMCGRPGAICMACARWRKHYADVTARRAAWSNYR